MKRRMPVALGLALGLALATLVGVPGCGQATDPWEGETGTKRVVVTIPALYSFVKGVAGKQGSVKCLCTTTGPHHYQADTRDARMLQKSDIVFGVGLKLDETFTNSLVKLTGRKDIEFVELGEKVPPKLLREQKHDEDDHDPKAKHKHAEGGHHHDHGSFDPHLWLGIPEAVAMVEVIRDELVKIDGEHKADYNKNAEEYIKTLKKLEKDGKVMLAEKKVKRIISFHDALGYFARTFDLRIVAVMEPGPGNEPNAAHLAKLVELCQKKDAPVDAIAVEPQFPKSTSAATLLKELAGKGINVKMVTVDPLETADPEELKKEGAGWYEARMRKNLKALADVGK